jgi:hypothetical protein
MCWGTLETWRIALGAICGTRLDAATGMVNAQIRSIVDTQIMSVVDAIGEQNPLVLIL